MYLTIIALGLVASYFILRSVFPFIFGGEMKPLTRQCYISVLFIFILSIAINTAVHYVPNIEIGNRILHTLGGGFLAFLVCFLVVRDGEFKIKRLQFFIFSLLIVIALGVLNELVEFVLQHYFAYVAATSIEDTWLDLTSNIIGLLLAAAIFIPFVNVRNNDKI